MVYSSTCFVSLMMTISICLYSSTLATTMRGQATPIKNHNVDQEDAIIAGRNHFADFLRALYAPQLMARATEMSNDVFPLTSSDGDDDVQFEEEEYDRDENSRHNEFPTESGVLLPILQKRNARYCGSFLADALQMACSNRKFFGKRSTLPTGKFSN